MYEQFGGIRKLMKTREEHPGLQLNQIHPAGWDAGWTLPDPSGFGIDRGQNTVVYHRWFDQGPDRLDRDHIVLNFSQGTQHRSFQVPVGGPWLDLISGVPLTPSDGWLHRSVGSNWGAIYYRRH